MSAFLERLGALLVAPRRLTRRDLGARDGKAGDDFLAFAVLALLLEGAGTLIHAAQALAAGRRYGALHQLVQVAQPALPLVLLWLAAAACFALFTLRVRQRAPVELGARVAQVFVLGSLVVSPLANQLDGGLRYALASAPWALSAIWFGLALREAIEPPPEAGPAPALPRDARLAGLALALACVTGGALHLDQALRAEAAAPQAIVARPGRPAPGVELPLLGGGRLRLAELRGRPVLLGFWATWCPPCLAELPELERAYAARGPDAPLVYAINIDEPSGDREARVRAVVERLGLRFPIALDDGKAAEAYSVTTIPTAVRVDAGGEIGAVFDRPLDAADLRDALR